MKEVSIFNDVLGPVMRGPSSSHTAASYRIGYVVRDLLGEAPVSVNITFDSNGSYVQVYRQQGSDLAMAAGLMGWEITHDRFERALEIAAAEGIEIRFESATIPEADHPNYVRIEASGISGTSITVDAKSTGGGGITVCGLNGHAIDFTGNSYFMAAEGPDFVAAMSDTPYKQVPGQWTADPIFFLKQCPCSYHSAQGLIDTADGKTLGQVALKAEANLLGKSEDEVFAEMSRRMKIMRESVITGLDDKNVSMRLLHPTASKIMQAENEGNLPTGGLHTQAAAAAMAAMHTCCSGGVVCAAPTGGSAGVLPGVLHVLELDEQAGVMALFAAGAVGAVLASRATFAAEIAGCQVEIGAAGAMAAAGIVEMAGGTALLACDAAAISFQNTMGSVCDLIQGTVEIPCHTRNAVAASSAFVCADLIMGGYHNPVPLDETIDAVLEVGQMLPSQLRCTSCGGLAITPSAQKMEPLK